MPKLTSQLPAYCHHKQSGQAIVYVNGRQIVLGTYNSAASRQKYNAIVGESGSRTAGRWSPLRSTSPSLIAKFL
jgi:hypothetical protein